jgi:hypothetical protein
LRQTPDVTVANFKEAVNAVLRGSSV